MMKNWCLAFGVVALIGMAGYSLSAVHSQLILKQTHNDLRWIGLALHQYHDEYGCFPPAVVYDDGRRELHSWRSLIEPQLAAVAQTTDSFPAYDFSQPWNSDANVDSDTSHRFGGHPYQFLAVVGGGAAWSGDEPRTIEDFSDGTTNTIMVIAIRNSGIRWHQPQDIAVVDRSLQLRGNELDLSSDYFILMANGSVHYCGQGLRDGVLEAMITASAGDEVPDVW